MQAIVDPEYFKNTEIISPGLVGSVGDTLVSVRLRQSEPNMRMRFDKEFSGKNEPRGGSNVQDGYSYSYTSGGGPAKTLDHGWRRQSFRTNHGWISQDLRVPDKMVQPIMGSTERYMWNNKVATLYEAKRTGDMFLPVPGGYQPSGIPRGGQVPRIVDGDTADPASLKTAVDKGTLPKEFLPPPPGNNVVYRVCTDANGNRTITQVLNNPTQQSQNVVQRSQVNTTTPTLRQTAPPVQQQQRRRSGQRQSRGWRDWLPQGDYDWSDPTRWRLPGSW